MQKTPTSVFFYLSSERRTSHLVCGVHSVIVFVFPQRAFFALLQRALFLSSTLSTSLQARQASAPHHGFGFVTDVQTQENTETAMLPNLPLPLGFLSLCAHICISRFDSIVGYLLSSRINHEKVIIGG